MNSPEFFYKIIQYATYRYANWTIIVCFLLLLVVACSVPQNDQESIDKIKQYYQLIKENRFDQAVMLYPAETRKNWQDFLVKQHGKWGSLRAFTINEVEMNTVYSGKYYLVILETEYERNRATETVTLFRKVTEDQLYIVSHKLDPE